MTCDQTQPLLEAFADSQLGWGTAWRVRRHLAACPTCAAQLAEVRHLDRRVRAWRDVSAPAGLGDRIAAALPSLPPAPSLPTRRALVTRRAAVGLAGMAAAGAAFFWLLPGQPGRPTIAFADVVNAMANVRTAHWTETTTAYDEESQADVTGRDNWLRLNPPALAEHTFSGTMAGSQVIRDGRGLRLYYPSGHKAFMEPYPYSLKSNGRVIRIKITEPFARQRMFEAIMPPQGWNDPAKLGQLNAQAGYGRFTRWGTRQVTEGGRTLTEFTSEFHPVGRRHGSGNRRTYWVDPRTRLVVRREDRIFAPGSERREWVIVCDHFQYNQEPPPGTFELSLPPGVNIQHRR